MWSSCPCGARCRLEWVRGEQQLLFASPSDTALTSCTALASTRSGLGGFVRVVSTTEDAPAWKAGVKPKDFITHVDGKLLGPLAAGLGEFRAERRIPEQLDQRLGDRVRRARRHERSELARLGRPEQDVHADHRGVSDHARRQP